MPDDDDRKFEELWRYRPRVRKFFSTLPLSRETVDDLTQEVFLRVYQHMDAYRGEAKSGYVEMIARNVARNHFRDAHARKRNAIMESDEKLAGMSDDRTPMDDVLKNKDASERLHRAVDRLDMKQRPCMRLYLAGLSNDEIAESLGLTVSAVKTRLNVARNELKKMLVGLEGFEDEP